MRIQNSLEDAKQYPELIGWYGAPGTGKSQGACALPWGPKWGQKAVYMAIDPRSAKLGSIRKEDREHLVVCVPEAVEIPGKGLVLDTNAQITEMITKDWKKHDPEIGTIIFDSVSIAADMVLKDIADSGAFSDKHITYGKGAAQLSVPMMGDYGAAQSVVRRWFRFLENQPLNVIAVFHGDVVDPEIGEASAAFGGPTTVGKAGVRDMARKFDNLFLVNVRGEGQPPKRVLKYEVYTTKKGVWEAKIRLGGPNPIPVVDTTGDPGAFWRAYDKAIEAN